MEGNDPLLDEIGFVVVDVDGDPISTSHLKVYFLRDRAECAAFGADMSSPKLAPHRMIEVRVTQNITDTAALR